MTKEQRFRFWGIGLVLSFVTLWMLSDIMLPFVAGMAIAYFLDPVADRLESWGLSRTLSTIVVTVLFIVVVLLLIALIIPAAVGQLATLAQNIPLLVDMAREKLSTLSVILQDRLSPESFDKIQAMAGAKFGVAAEWIAGRLARIVGSSLAFFNLLSLIFLTPVVTFFLLRDWDVMVARVDSWLPRGQAETIRELAREADRTLDGYARGMAMVCMILGGYYAVALSLAGLNSGLAIGIIAGLLTIIPYVGSITGLVLSVGMAAIQFNDPLYVIGIAVIFFIGQAVEGNYLTPKLVGEKVGLHPVIVIFALLAGGALLGFTGVLIAMPVAAVLGVLVRFALSRYLSSAFYGASEPATMVETDSKEE